MYVIDCVSYIVRKWVGLLLGSVVMGGTLMVYEIGFWNVRHRQWVTCVVHLVEHVCHGLYT